MKLFSRLYNPPGEKKDYQISKRNKDKFQRVQSKKMKKGLSKLNRFLYNFSINYNKCPQNSLKIFKNIQEERQKNDLLCHQRLNDVKVSNDKKLDFDHFREVEKFKKNQTNGHPVSKQNYGIAFNVPEFIQFDHPTRRLKEKIILDQNNLEITAALD